MLQAQRQANLEEKKDSYSRLLWKASEGRE
jgi:hypothetical protein